MVKLESAASITVVYPGGNTVLAMVIIVVKYRTCLLVGRLIIGVQAQSFG